MSVNVKYKTGIIIIVLSFIFNTMIYSQQWYDIQGGVGAAGLPGASIDMRDMVIYQNQLYVSGNFNLAGGTNVCGLGLWNGTSWSDVRCDLFDNNGEYTAFFYLGLYGGNLYCTGSWDITFNGEYTGLLIMWDGTQWNKVDNYDATGDVFTLCEYQGKLYVGGNLTRINGVNVHRIACWDGSTWSDVAGGLTGGFGKVYDMVVYNNELYVAGNFYYAGGLLSPYISRWNGLEWDSLKGYPNSYITDLVVDSANNTLYVGGSITEIDSIPVKLVACWNGSTWSAVGEGITHGIMDLAMYHGNLYACGQANYLYYTDTVVACWDGAAWHPVYGLNNTATSMEVYNDDLYIGGYFTKAFNDTVNHIVRYNDATGFGKVNTNEESFLDNNIPNPSKGTVIIPYTLPAGKTGELKIYGVNGENIGIYNLEAGSKTIEINTSGWQSGTYIYSLYIDKKQRYSKKMIVQ